MTNDGLLEQLRKHLDELSKEPADVTLDRLREIGIIDEHGEVTGHVRRWLSTFAITAVQHNSQGDRIESFRCLKPVFGLPGDKTTDISRDAMVGYLKKGEPVITAIWDARLDMWKQGGEVRLSDDGFVVCDSSGAATQDDVGDLPEFQQSTPKL